jgi:hypothetical protein
MPAAPFSSAWPTSTTRKLFSQTDNGVGLISRRHLVSNGATNGRGRRRWHDGSFRFKPSAVGPCLLSQADSRGPVFLGAVHRCHRRNRRPENPGAAGIDRSTGGRRIRLVLKLEKGTAKSLGVETAGAISGPWTFDATAIVEAIGTPGNYQPRDRRIRCRRFRISAK